MAQHTTPIWPVFASAVGTAVLVSQYPEHKVPFLASGAFVTLFAYTWYKYQSGQDARFST